jgi:DNA-binding response OmpR family regulator
MASTKTILVIDDEANLRRSLALLLQRAGYLVTTAANAQEAEQLLQAGAYDLAFLDIKLPDRNGMALLPEMRRTYPDMPVLILTANATLDSAIEAVRQGARDYLLKPIDPENILARVREVLVEQGQPRRRREITMQIQNLLSELRMVDNSDLPPSTLLSSLSPTDPARYLQRGPLTLDLHTRHVMLEDRYIPLPPSTFDYLVTLMRHSPEPVPYETLVMESQGYSRLTRTEAREMTRWQIHELRKALEPDPRHPCFVYTVRDVGYRLVI